MKKNILKIIIFILILTPLISHASVTVTTENATDIKSTETKLNGTLHKILTYIDTYVYFKYLDSTTTTVPTSCSNFPVSLKTPYLYMTQSGIRPFSYKITNLKPSTKYYYCAATYGINPISYGVIKSFTTTACPTCTPTTSPTVTTTTAGNFTYDGAMFSGILKGIATPDLALNPKLPTTVYFRYSDMEVPPVFCNDIYGNNMVSTKDIPLDPNLSNQNFDQTINNLKESTIYYYCAIVSNKNKIAYGEVNSFQTPPCPTCKKTTVTTAEAVVPNQTSAWLKGTYSSTVPIKTFFEYKKDTSTNEISIGGNSQSKDFWTKINSSEQAHHSNSYGNLSFLLSGLTPGTKYNFRLTAETTKLPLEITNGNTMNFTTKSSGTSGLVFVPETSPLGAVELNNILNPGGAFGQSATNLNGTTLVQNGEATLGQIATPPADAVVRYHEGIEIVLVRQIMANPDLAKRYGYVEGANLENFAWNLADLFARIFGYVGENGKEIRVTVPDMAAYQVLLVGNKLTIYEYFNNRIVNIQSMTESLRNTYEYEYYFRK